MVEKKKIRPAEVVYGSDPRKYAPSDQSRGLLIERLAESSLAMQKLQEQFPEARTIADAQTELGLMVTEQHVKDAQPGNPANCALAVCARESDTTLTGGMIGRVYAYLIYRTGHVVRYQLNKNAQIRTGMFDDRRTMVPGLVLLSVPSKTHRLGSVERQESRARSRRTEGAKAQKKAQRQRDKAKRNFKQEQAITHGIVSHGLRVWEWAKRPKLKG